MTLNFVATTILHLIVIIIQIMLVMISKSISEVHLWILECSCAIYRMTSYCVVFGERPATINSC